ncbi:ribosome biogenesis protein [Candidatus Micrarchaeota archaeon CG_4_10_14_0_2_um_filter_55_9]|nr:MAG: ribosome biogenesis protein [Candidatus Micrarchaeota archaeon CG09_land_8_20_14_0_10_55_25]PIZ91664.1 MAG: ribosome biogenesis protein [Candidatus Micrarchaeota archaeon CG_4_10_14_0_2_um_filter_55_9]PJD01606.1 MAG: ribosome biogenesis protein [Candidatus Micrarchaeota archaeon CG10_big_fil_rev_8_21_14_0_10_54_18]
MKCGKCGKYSLRDECCEPTQNPHPPKYSPADKYAKYRRKEKYGDVK